MKKILLGLVVASVIIASCVKTDNKCGYTDSNAVVPASQIDSLQKLLSDSGITATQHASGFFYTIDNAGSGTGITNLCSTITVNYKGSFFNKHVFDSTATGSAATFQLGQVIVGWQKGIPLISKNGDITLYIPPALGYGAVPATDSQGNVVIPANSYLKFKVHLADIQ